MESELANVPFGKRIRLLFWNFFKIALFVVGGGYAIILAAEEIFVRKLRWLKDGELLEMLTVIQAIPGLTPGTRRSTSATAPPDSGEHWRRWSP